MADWWRCQRKPKPKQQKVRHQWGRKRRRKKRRDEPAAAEDAEADGEDTAAAEGTPHEEPSATEAEQAMEDELKDLIRFVDLAAPVRVRVLRVLCDLCCEESDTVWDHCNQHVEQASHPAQPIDADCLVLQVRLQAVGEDTSGCQILHIGKECTRLFR